MTLSIEQSILKLKEEIISQEWHLPQRRIPKLEEAFACLSEKYASNKSMSAILTMADSTLSYIKKNEQNAPPDCIDFLKEAMAMAVIARCN